LSSLAIGLPRRASTLRARQEKWIAFHLASFAPPTPHTKRGGTRLWFDPCHQRDPWLDRFGRVCLPPYVSCGIARHALAVDGATWHAHGLAWACLVPRSRGESSDIPGELGPSRHFLLCHLFRVTGERGYNPRNDETPSNGKVIMARRW
jgi:hypothetical protein